MIYVTYRFILVFLLKFLILLYLTKLSNWLTGLQLKVKTKYYPWINATFDSSSSILIYVGTEIYCLISLE